MRSCIDRLIENRKRFVVAYFDLDSFKPYNDVYGYAQGDQVILHLAGLLKNMFSARLDFVGHVGGDDFLVVMRSADWRERVNRMHRALLGDGRELLFAGARGGRPHHRRGSR